MYCCFAEVIFPDIFDEGFSHVGVVMCQRCQGHTGMLTPLYGHVIISSYCEQCGFKLFTRSVAQRLFPVYHVERWYVCVCLYCCVNCGYS